MLTLLPFVSTWTTAIYISAENFLTSAQNGEKKSELMKFALPITEENIEDVIELYSIFYGTSKYKLIIKILLTSLNLPLPYVLSEELPEEEEQELSKKLLISTLDKLLEKSKKESKFFELLFPLILKDYRGVTWLLENN